MDFHQARAIAEQALDQWVRRPEVAVAVDDTRTREHPAHWIFFYDTQAFLQTGNPDTALAGNVPLVVDRRTGSFWFAQPLVPVEEQLS